MTRPATRRAPRRRHLRAVALLVVASVVAVLVCSGCSTPTATSVTSDAVVKINTSTAPGARAKQILDVLNSDVIVGSNDVRALAGADVAPSVQSTMENLWWDHPFTLTGVDYFAGRVVLHLLNSYGARQNIEIHTDDTGLVDRFGFELVKPVIKSWADVDAALRTSGAKYSYQVAKVNDGRCERVAGTNTAESLPLASIFKLYVLYAVADAVTRGTLSWDDELTVTARAKAVDYSGLPEFPLGSKVSVRRAADKMIAISSNMATDLLIDRVGTPAVERALVAAGHHDPQSMTPFPTMHDMFSIGWGEPDLRQQWKDAVATGSPQPRAELLKRVNPLPYQQDPARVHTPASLFGAEWYGTAEDICRVHTALQAAAVGAAAPVRDILAETRGIDLDGQQWPYIGSKGGSLPGDLTFSWYAVDSSGQPWVVSFQVNWPVFRGPNAGGWLISIAKQVFAMVNSKP